MRMFCCLLLIFLSACEESPESNFARAINLSRQFVESYMEETKVPGMSICVSYKNDIIWSEGFGFADIENNVFVTPLSKFRVASVSKPITAVLTAYLHEKGCLDIDAKIYNYVKSFPKKRWDFSIRDLICHGAGIRHYRDADTTYKKFHSNIQSGLKIFQHDTLLFEPKSRFSYSSYSYNLVGAAIENITGDNFSNILHDSLFVCLGMKNSTADSPIKIISNRVSPYIINETGEIVNAPFFDNRYKIPAGGILSTPEDLAVFANQTINGDFISEETKNLLFTPYQFTEESESDTGFGWIVTKDNAGNKLYGHLGGISGGCSALLIYPDRDLIIAWTGNLNTEWSEKPTQIIANYFLDLL